jgi:hypothetical protein
MPEPFQRTPAKYSTGPVWHGLCRVTDNIETATEGRQDHEQGEGPQQEGIDGAGGHLEHPMTLGGVGSLPRPSQAAGSHAEQ